MLARRRALGEGRAPAYSFDELARLTHVSTRRARASVARLGDAGLLLWSGSAIAFPEPPDAPDAGPLADTIGGGIGDLVVPRRVLRSLAQGATAALIATALSVLLRCLSRRRGGFHGRGRIKASWIANAFAVDPRAVKAARRHLIGIGWIRPEPSDQAAENRWGRAYRIDLDWAPTTAPGRCRVSPPPPGPACRVSPPPLLHRDPLRGGEEHQDPACGGRAGVHDGVDGEKHASMIAGPASGTDDPVIGPGGAGARSEGGPEGSRIVGPGPGDAGGPMRGPVGPARAVGRSAAVEVAGPAVPAPGSAGPGPGASPGGVAVGSAGARPGVLPPPGAWSPPRAPSSGAGGGPGRPRLDDIRAEDLADVGRLLELHGQAAGRGLIGTSEADRLKFLAAAEHARAVGRVNPCGLLARLVRGGLWDYATQGEEGSASRRLREHLHGGARGVGVGLPGLGCVGVAVAVPSMRRGLSDDARLVGEIRAGLTRAGYRGDPLPLLRARDGTWTRARWDRASAEWGSRGGPT